MGDPKGFLKVRRQFAQYRPVCERVKDYSEVLILRPEEISHEQGSRCMDCGTPFCHWGCPVGNYIPEWNDAIFHGRWQEAIDFLQATNNFPEFTGRLCPAMCEYSCVLGINDDPVTIRENELDIIEHAFKMGLIKPRPPKMRTGKKVAVIGSGPAGLAAADQLNKAGHRVTVFEKDDKVGGILRYGIPDFKLEKKIVDRRVAILKSEGIIFKTNIEAGKDYTAADMKKDFDAIVIACGSRTPRDLNIEGRNLKGICFAMDYLIRANARAAGEEVTPDKMMDSKDKRVVVIGGGDTGADCVGIANRQGARCVVQIEIMPRPAEYRTAAYPWPRYPVILKTSTSHEEGAERNWSIETRRFVGENGAVKRLVCRRDTHEEFEIEAEMVILALGFLHPERSPLIDGLKLALDSRGNIATDSDYRTSTKKVFAAGDGRTGQSLIVRAISEGRRAAHFVDKFLMGCSSLPVI